MLIVAAGKPLIFPAADLRFETSQKVCQLFKLYCWFLKLFNICFSMYTVHTGKNRKIFFYWIVRTLYSVHSTDCTWCTICSIYFVSHLCFYKVQERKIKFCWFLICWCFLSTLSLIFFQFSSGWRQYRIQNTGIQDTGYRIHRMQNNVYWSKKTPFLLSSKEFAHGIKVTFF